MRKLLVAAVLGVSLAAGCAQLGFSPTGTIPVDKTLSPQAQAIQTTINEGNVLATAVAKVAKDDFDGGIITSAEKDAVVIQLRKAREGLSTAQTLLRGGNLADAKSRADFEKSLILTLQKQLAAKAHGG